MIDFDFKTFHALDLDDQIIYVSAYKRSRSQEDLVELAKNKEFQTWLSTNQTYVIQKYLDGNNPFPIDSVCH